MGVVLGVNLKASDSAQIFLSFSKVVKPGFWEHLENLKVDVFWIPLPWPVSLTKSSWHLSGFLVRSIWAMHNTQLKPVSTNAFTFWLSISLLSLVIAPIHF